MGFHLIPLSEASCTRMHAHTHTHTHYFSLSHTHDYMHTTCTLSISVTHTRLHAHNTHTLYFCHTHTTACTQHTHIQFLSVTHTTACTTQHSKTQHTRTHSLPHNQNSSCTLTLWPSSHNCCTHNCSFYNTSQPLQTSHIVCQHIPSSVYVQSLLNTNYVYTWQKYTSTVCFLHNNAYVKTKNRTNGFAYTWCRAK